MFGLRGGSGAETPQSPGVEAEDELTNRLVEEAISLCEARGWSILGILAGLSAPRVASMTRLFFRHKVPVVIFPAKIERPDLYYRIDGHWHAAGHAFVADRVLEAFDAIGMGRL